MAGNISFGTYVTDGLRSGPLYSGPVPLQYTPANPQLKLTYSSYQQYGPGVLYSPISTYNITPQPGAVDNVVATTANGAVPAATYLQIRGDNIATRYFGGASPYVQFDWPRVVSVTIAGATATPGTRVTIFGYDWYNNPMQHTYIVNAVGTYPAVDTNDGFLFLSVPAKAFYSVTGAYVNSGLPAGCTISLGVMNVFGLPYLINNFGDTLGIGWGDNSDITSAQQSVYGQGSVLNPLGLFAGADKTLPSSETGDVRGLYSPSGVPNGDATLRFTYYVQGADQWLNQVANAQQEGLQNNTPVTGVEIEPLSPAVLYGFPQFYTGNPS